MYKKERKEGRIPQKALITKIEQEFLQLGLFFASLSRFFSQHIVKDFEREKRERRERGELEVNNTNTFTYIVD